MSDDFFQKLFKQSPINCEDSLTKGLYHVFSDSTKGLCHLFSVRWPCPSFKDTLASQTWQMLYWCCNSNISDNIYCRIFWVMQRVPVGRWDGKSTLWNKLWVNGSVMAVCGLFSIAGDYSFQWYVSNFMQASWQISRDIDNFGMSGKVVGKSAQPTSLKAYCIFFCVCVCVCVCVCMLCVCVCVHAGGVRVCTCCAFFLFYRA